MYRFDLTNYVDLFLVSTHSTGHFGYHHLFASDTFFVEMYLVDELEQWMVDHGFPHSLDVCLSKVISHQRDAIKYEHVWVPQELRYYLTFDRPQHLMLFKLTWV